LLLLLLMKWHTKEQVAHPRASPGRIAAGGAQRPSSGVADHPWCGDAGSAGAAGQRPRVDEHGECRLASRILPPCLRRSPKVAEVPLVRHLRGLFDGGPPPRARDRCSMRTLWDLVGDEHRAADGSMRYAWRSSSSFARQPGWMPVRVCVGERGAIRCRSQTELDTPSVEYLVQPQLRTRPTVALPMISFRATPYRSRP